jgi:hypothetical protein
MLKTLNFTKTEKRRYMRNLNKARRSLGQNLIFPVETEDKLWNYLEEYFEVET